MPDNLSLTRRTVLSAATAGVGAAAIGATPAMAQARKTFVLVHGAWHGGWCWRRVSDLLEKQGHKVFTPTLTGARRPLASPQQGGRASTPTSPTS